MVPHEMNPSKTLNNKYVPEDDGPRKNKNSPHYKLKYELHIFEQRICIILAHYQKKVSQIPFATQHGGKKILIRTRFFRLSRIWLAQIYKESCLMTQLCTRCSQ